MLWEFNKKLVQQVSIGKHSQTAFALGLMLDYARGVGDTKFADLIVSKDRQFSHTWMGSTESGMDVRRYRCRASQRRQTPADDRGGR